MTLAPKVRAKPGTLAERFWPKVEVRGPDECWLWIASLRQNGYGQIWEDDRNLKAHQASWIIHNGPIPAGLVVCHTCDNRRCVNPAHLYVATQGQNLADARAKGRMYPPPRRALPGRCAAGHDVSGSNAYIRPTGHACCRICRREQDRRLRARSLVVAGPSSSEATP